MRISLSKKIFFNFLILSIVPIIIIDTYFYYKSKNALINRTFDQLTTARIEKTARLTDFFNKSIKDILALSQENLECVQGDYNDKNSIENFDNRVKRYISNYKAYNKIIFISKDDSICSFNNKGSLQLPNYKDSIDYKTLLSVIKQIKQINTPVFYDIKNSYTSKNRSVLLIYKKNKYSNKETIVLEISLNAINKIIFESNPYSGLGKTGETYIVGSDYYMRSTSRFADSAIFNLKVETIAAKEAFKNKEGTKQILDYRNIPVLSSYGKVDIKGLNWVVISETDTKEAMIPIYLIRNDILFMSLVLGILLLGLVEILSSKITAPVIRLKQATDRIIQGERAIYIDIKSNDEIGDLIVAFNKMIEQLEEQTVILEQERILRAKSLFDGQEIERQRLSRELHDSIGQSILALKIKFERIRESSEEKRLVIISETEELFLKIMTEIRNISNDLMPAVLTEFGLLMAIKKIIRDFSTSTNIKIDFIENISNIAIEKKIEVHIYRIVQEALSNILKHAFASKIEIKIFMVDGVIELTIRDNGKGLVLNEETQLKGNGISNIKERINLIGGKIKFKSAINKGTSIFCEIPII